jgi:hypothetical protein
MPDEPLRFSLKVNDFDEVVLIHQGGSFNLGPKDDACERMAEFLAAIDYGEQ